MSVRWRLTLYIALVIGAILLVLGFALYLLLRDSLLSNVEEITRSRALSAAQDIRDGEALGGDDVEQLTLDGVFVVVRDGGGEVLSQTIELPRNGPRDRVWRRALASGGAASGTVELSQEAPYYVYAVPVESPDDRARVVEAGKSYEPAREAIATVRTVLGAGIGAALLLSIGGAYFLARAALRPVEAVTSAAREMGEGDLARRLPVANPRDEIGRLAATINGLLARLEAAFARREETLARQRRFTADASHELRTPLTSIGGHARMLDEWALERDPQTARRSVRAIRQEAGRMRGLVESLLALARGDEGAPLEVEHHDLAAVADEAVQTARAAADGKVSIEHVPGAREVMATFDHDSVLRLANILLDNAVKHTPEGGRIAVRVREEGDRALLEVSDTGTGIPEEKLDRVFERFYRLDPSRTGGGAGLGLSIARQIAESHGGELQAASKPGEGSTFTLLLPKRPRTAPDASS